jgi:hypothetical protein
VVDYRLGRGGGGVRAPRRRANTRADLDGGLVFLAVLAERFFGFELGRRQWIGIGLVAVSLALLTATGGSGGEATPWRG